jgi:hypothetical protein
MKRKQTMCVMVLVSLTAGLPCLAQTKPVCGVIVDGPSSTNYLAGTNKCSTGEHSKRLG